MAGWKSYCAGWLDDNGRSDAADGLELKLRAASAKYWGEMAIAE
jgi:hypothetical protein